MNLFYDWNICIVVEICFWKLNHFCFQGLLLATQVQGYHWYPLRMENCIQPEIVKLWRQIRNFFSVELLRTVLLCLGWFRNVVFHGKQE